MPPNAMRFQSLLDAMPDALLGVDQAGIIRFLNRRTESVFGYDRGQLIGQRIETLIPEVLRAGHPAHRANYAAAPETRPMGAGVGLTGQRRDGTEFPVDVSLSSFQTKEGILVTATVRDVTEQRKAFEAAQRLAAIIENSDDAIIGKTLAGIITSWNPAAERMFGLSGQEAIGRPVGLLSPQSRAGEITDILAKITAGQPVEHLESERVRKDGTVFPVSLGVSPIRDVLGVVVGASTICRDVTERVQAEKALAEAGRQYRLLAENASDLVVLASPDRVITWVSPSVTRRLGWAVADLIGTRLVELVHPEDAAATAALRDAAYSGHDVSQPAGGSVLRIRTKSGHYRWMSGDVTPVRDDSDVHVGVVTGLRDVEALVLAREAAQADRVALRATLDSLIDPHVR